MEKTAKVKKRIRVLWLTNLCPRFIADRIGLPSTNKEGWVTGMAGCIMKDGEVTFGVAFPSDKELSGISDDVYYYGFVEDTTHPEIYNAETQSSLEKICDDFQPDTIHIFGTEYPHTLSMLKIERWKNRTLIHLQGLMEPYANEYTVGLPQNVIKRKTFRDILRHDSIPEQKEKYLKRAAMEKEVLCQAVNVCGRTEFDRSYALKINKELNYYELNETLRNSFYEGSWDIKETEPHSIFVSQGNYPLKGVHFLLRALPAVKEKYPDVRVYISGDNVTKHETLKEKIKLSSYGKYLLSLLRENKLSDNVFFLGQKNEAEMKELYLKCQLFVIPSVLENSPNSLGEAMILGVPCIAARVGGIPSMALEDEVSFYELTDVSELSRKIIELFEDEKKLHELRLRGQLRGQSNHNREKNYKTMKDIYLSIGTDKQ